MCADGGALEGGDGGRDAVVARLDVAVSVVVIEVVAHEGEDVGRVDRGREEEGDKGRGCARGEVGDGRLEADKVGEGEVEAAEEDAQVRVVGCEAVRWCGEGRRVGRRELGGLRRV